MGIIKVYTCFSKSLHACNIPQNFTKLDFVLSPRPYPQCYVMANHVKRGGVYTCGSGGATNGVTMILTCMVENTYTFSCLLALECTTHYDVIVSDQLEYTAPEVSEKYLPWA